MCEVGSTSSLCWRLCFLCLCGSLLLSKTNHRDTEDTEAAPKQTRKTPLMVRVHFEVTPKTLPYSIRTRSVLLRPEGFWLIHLLGFRRQNDELARRRGTNDITVVVNATPQQRGESLRTFVSQVLMIEPNRTPQALFFGVFRNALSHRQLRIQRFKPCRQIINQRNVVTTRRRHHRQAHAYSRPGLDVPDAFAITLNVPLIVKRCPTRPSL